MSDSDNAVRVVGADGHDTIQAAHDALPEDGGRIRYTDSYDASNETFPITLSKPHALVGDGVTPVENDDSDVDTVVVDMRKTLAPTFYWRDVRVAGGDVAVRLQAGLGRIDGGLVEEFGACGVLLDSGDGDWSPNTVQIHETEVRRGDGDGVLATEKSHALDLVSARVHKNGGRGVATNPASTIASLNVRAGVVQRNDGYGIHAENDLNVVVHGTYFEGNGRDEPHPGEIRLRDTDAALVEGCYGNGSVGYDADYFVVVDGAARTAVRGLRANSYASALVRAGGGASDLDLHRASHALANVPRVLDAETDDLVRPRSDGVVGPVDLTARADGDLRHPGEHVGELAVHDGSGDRPEGLYYWSDGGWIDVAGDGAGR